MECRAWEWGVGLPSQLAVQARTFLDSQPDLALLSLEAYQVYNSVETRSSLLSALEPRLQVSAFLRGATAMA